jgi:hypothetical protein
LHAGLREPAVPLWQVRVGDDGEAHVDRCRKA